MKITYIIGTLLLLASLAIAQRNTEDPKDRHLRTTKNTPGLVVVEKEPCKPNNDLRHSDRREKNLGSQNSTSGIADGGSHKGRHE